MTEQLRFETPWLEHSTTDRPPPVRSVQYLGSKARFVEPIARAISELAPGDGRALDIFSGSGSVAGYLARTRAVTAVDVQEYARVLASAVLRPWRGTTQDVEGLAAEASRRTLALLSQPALKALHDYEQQALSAVTKQPEKLAQLLEHGSIEAASAGALGASASLSELLRCAYVELSISARDAVLTRQFGGVYFGYEQAAVLDGLLGAIRSVGERELIDTALAATMRAASVTVTSVGNHFAQPVRPRDAHGELKQATLQGVARARTRDVQDLFLEQMTCYARAPETIAGSKAVTADFRIFLTEAMDDVSVAYADPPYTRDHYSRFYHVLETMARGDDPRLSMVTTGDHVSPSRGLYREGRHQSPFSIRTQVREAFDGLFAGLSARGIPLVLSYSPYSGGTLARPQPRLLTVEQIVCLAQEHFTSVEVRSLGAFRHSKFNASIVNGEAHSEAEQLILCAL